MAQETNMGLQSVKRLKTKLTARFGFGILVMNDETSLDSNDCCFSFSRDDFLDV